MREKLDVDISFSLPSSTIPSKDKERSPCKLSGNSSNQHDIQNSCTETSGVFKDSIPSTLPYGYSQPKKYCSEKCTTWCRLLHVFPRKWPISNLIVNTYPWLNSVHLPVGHRAYITMQNPDSVRGNHQILFWRASLHYLLSRNRGEIINDSAGDFENIGTDKERR